jgi:hypothetical protein
VTFPELAHIAQRIQTRTVRTKHFIADAQALNSLGDTLAPITPFCCEAAVDGGSIEQ